MEEILAQIAFYQDAEIDDELFDKIKGTPRVGSKVTVKWVDREYDDHGYCFRLPIQDDEDDMLDLCLHITDVDNSDGIGEAPEVWIHLLNLLENERCDYVIFK